MAAKSSKARKSTATATEESVGTTAVHEPEDLGPVELPTIEISVGGVPGAVSISSGDCMENNSEDISTQTDSSNSLTQKGTEELAAKVKNSRSFKSSSLDDTDSPAAQACDDEQSTASEKSSADSRSGGEAQLSPMMRQYFELKAQAPDSLLLFRLGDFFELFDEDAHVGARELQITLTGRPEPTYPGGRVPMAGIPYKAWEGYVGKLLSKGYSVAITDQVGIAGQQKGPVERKLIRILTPGTVLESDFLPARENNFLVAIASGGAGSKLWGLAAVDASCGEFLVTQVSEDNLLPELARLSPRELLVAKRTTRGIHGLPVEEMDAPQAVKDRYKLTGRPSMFFQLEPGRRRIMQIFNVSTLEGFGCHEMPLAVSAAGAVLEYLERTQTSSMAKFSSIVTYSVGEHLILDENARKNLELTETVRDRKSEGSLLWCLDKTRTGPGSRLLRNWLLKPLLSISRINERQDAVQELVDDATRRRKIDTALRDVSDLERLSVRLSSGNATPKDLEAIACSLAQLPSLAEALQDCRSPYLTAVVDVPSELADLYERIEGSITPEPPREITNGGIFRKGYSAELDEIRSLLGGGKQWIEEFQQKEQERTRVKSLKVSFNSTFGYYIEITHANRDNVPADYIRKQTLTNAERYITPELKEYEAKVLNAEKNQSDIEYRLFVELRQELAKFGEGLKKLSASVAAVDVLCSLATVAAENRYCRPVVDDSLALEVEAGRHAVLEKLLPMGVYVSNDTYLYGNAPEEQMMILTGPNMSGKSSYLRQIALIAILAQAGSFVPATRAHVGVVDRIFTRIGAVDDLGRGQSTFLVEMSETAQCCLCATERSLILLDEIGRGTSTYDGVAIAWSVSEHLASQVKARTIFATHYHELNGLAAFWPQIVNHQVQVAEFEGRVEFLHKVGPGGASRSFGIHVAGMAGLPANVLDRAHYLMSQMEKKGAAGKILDGPRLRTIPIDEVNQLSLFAPRG